MRSSAMTRSERLVVVGVVVASALLAVQPAFVSRAPERQTEFTWEMFSKAGPRDEFVVDLGDRTILRATADLVSPARANTDYTSVLPPHICATMPQAVSVTVVRADEVIGLHECGP